MSKNVKRAILISTIALALGLPLLIKPLAHLTEGLLSDPLTLDPIALTVPEYFKEQQVNISTPAHGEWGTTVVSLNPLAIHFEGEQEGIVYTVTMKIPSEKTPEAIENQGNRIYLTEVQAGVDLEILFYDGYILPKIILKTPAANRKFQFKLEGIEKTTGQPLVFDASVGGYVMAKTQSGKELFMLRSPQGTGEGLHRIDYAWEIIPEKEPKVYTPKYQIDPGLPAILQIPAWFMHTVERLGVKLVWAATTDTSSINTDASRDYSTIAAGETAKDGVLTTADEVQKGECYADSTFTGGVLAINTNKSIYLPNEQVFLQMAALDDNGHTICNADLKLEITSPIGELERPEVIRSGKCHGDNLTDEPDYFAYYKTKEPGKYTMRLVNVSNGYQIVDYFEVRDSAAFDIERKAPTRIYPVETYPVRLEIKANEDFTGRVSEAVPESFEISSTHPASEVSLAAESGDSSTSEVKNISWQVDWKKGETYKLGYEFDAPDVSPQFYLLGPLKIGEIFEEEGDSFYSIFSEARQWQIAADDIAIDGTASVGTGEGDTTVSHTTGSGLNRLMLVGISGASSTGGSGPTINSVKYNGVSLDYVTALNDSYRKVLIYSLVAPDVGTHNLVVDYAINPSNGGIVGVMTFTGVDQDTPLGTPNCAIGTSVTVSSDVGELVFDTAGAEGAGNPGAGQTEHWYDYNDYAEGAGSTRAGASPTVTNTWSDSEVICGCSIKPCAYLDQANFQFFEGSGALPSYSVGSAPDVSGWTFTPSGTATDTTSYNAAYPPSVSAGDLLIWVVAKDDDDAITDTVGNLTEIGTSMAGDPITNANQSLYVAYEIADGDEGGTTHNFTADLEDWSIYCIKIPAGTFDPVTPIDPNVGIAVGTVYNQPTVDTAALTPDRSNGRVVATMSVDTDPMDATFSPSGWTDRADQDITDVTAAIATRDAATTASTEVGSASFGINTGDTSCSVVFVVNAPRTATGRTPIDDAGEDVTLDTYTHYGWQFRIENIGSAESDDEYKLQYYHVQGTATWTDITDTSDVIRAFLTDDFVNGADVPEYIVGNGTYTSENNAALESTGALILTANLAANYSFEGHLNFLIVGEDVDDEDTIQLRVIYGNDDELEHYTDIPTITVNYVTFVRLASFYARGYPDRVEAVWQTGCEIDNVGFNLYRSLESNGQYKKLNAKVIPGLGDTTLGNTYNFIDTGINFGTNYYYKLQDIDRYGIKTQHGPVVVEWENVRKD